MTPRWPVISFATAGRRTVAGGGPLAVSLGFYVVVVGIISALWRAAAGAGGGEVAGYTAVAITWYLATSEAAIVSLNIRMIEQIGDDIAGGAVAVELLRPAPVLGVRLASELGTVLPRLAGCALLGASLCLVVVGRPPDGRALALAAPSLVLAVACNVVAQHAFAAAAFWVRDARSSWFLYQKMVFILGGMLLPLEILPGWLGGVASVLPFMAMAYAPARLASGHLEPQLLLVQAAWLGALVLAARAAFAAGERRLQVVGG
jgi:ABC-2 type transport system permease protein